MAGPMTMAFMKRWGNLDCPACDEPEFVTVGTVKNSTLR